MGCSHLEPLDPRVRRTRKLLQEALRDLMHEKDFAAISVQDVTERATVNRATFYAHYPDKLALLTSLVQADFHEFVSPRFPEFPDLGRESLTAMFATILEFVSSKEQCPDSASGLDRVIVAALQDEVHSMFRAWLDHSGPNPFTGHKPELVAVVLTSTILGASCRWGHGKKKVDADALAKALVALLLPAVPMAATRG